MDNLYFKKLPSDDLPTVTGSDVVLAETASGGLKLIDSDGVHSFLFAENVFRKNELVIRTDDVSPASYLGGTWEKIGQGRMLIGANEQFPLGSTGGEATHTLTIQELPSHNHHLGWSDGSVSIPLTFLAMAQSFRNPGDAGTNNINTTYTGEGLPHNNMPPYLAVNIWQRIA